RAALFWVNLDFTRGSASRTILHCPTQTCRHHISRSRISVASAPRARSSIILPLTPRFRSRLRSPRLEAETGEMLDPARRDDQAIDSGRVEHEAQRGLGHALLARLR